MESENRQRIVSLKLKFQLQRRFFTHLESTLDFFVFFSVNSRSSMLTHSGLLLLLAWMRNSLERRRWPFTIAPVCAWSLITRCPSYLTGGAHRMSTRTYRRPRRRRGRSTMIWQNEPAPPEDKDDADHHDSMEVDSFESNQLHHQSRILRLSCSPVYHLGFFLI